jgi:hypothetical protein
MLMPELDGYQVLEHARPSRDAAFMSIPEVRDPPVDQLILQPEIVTLLVGGGSGPA